MQFFFIRPDNMPRSTHKCFNISYPSYGVNWTGKLSLIIMVYCIDMALLSLCMLPSIFLSFSYCLVSIGIDVLAWFKYCYIPVLGVLVS